MNDDCCEACGREFEAVPYAPNLMLAMLNGFGLVCAAILGASAFALWVSGNTVAASIDVAAAILMLGLVAAR